MKRNYLLLLSMSFILLSGAASAQSSVLVSNTNVATSSQTDAVQAQENPITKNPNTVVIETAAEKEIPSAFKFLIKDCELKEGFYYLPRAKFLALTQQQQDYLLTNKTKFIIED